MDNKSTTSPAHWEAEYNPRVRVPEPEIYFDAWVKRAAGVRQTLPGLLDVAYGAGPRELLDLFRAKNARGTLVFIHGGYWRAFDKNSFSWVAEPFVRAGLTVAVVSYPLCPTVRLRTIVESVSAAVGHLQRTILTPAERRKTVLVGHSAGGHLAACVMAAAHREVDGPVIDAIVCISGLFDLIPLMHTQMLGNMGWSADELHAVSPLYMEQPARGTVLLVVGADESVEFHSQSVRMARAWTDRTAVMFPAGREHFSVVDELGRSDYEVTRAAIELFD